MSLLLTVNNLSLYYLTRFGEKIHAVSNVSFELRRGSVLGIAGESGCGKSTLVNGVMGLHLPPLYHASGDIEIDGHNILEYPPEKLRRDILGKKISMIPQSALNSLNPMRKIKHFATDIMQHHTPEMSTKNVHARLQERFDAIGLGKHILDTFPVELSGGMKQRVVIALSTLMNPQVVIADEPSSALDVSTQKAVIQLLIDLMRKKIIGSMIFITHELPLLYHIAGNIAVMYAGEFVEFGSSEQIVRDPLHPYSRTLMEAMLLAEEGTRDRQAKAVAGAPPSLGSIPEGCRFAPRCPTVHTDTCYFHRQQMHAVQSRRVRCEYV
ncbi:MAG: ATP-binding cassette domain-containing protein [Chitinivibrionales bacterium]|nr:ATP-binding cassette domain-containing protein [Chitinivibrionales bacterium]